METQDLWGKSSDHVKFKERENLPSRNPRFVGQVFRLSTSATPSNTFGRNPRFVGQVFRQNRC
ncbi:hypothetical protein NEICINOT_05167 [Neisseria cinerea ATCC 14685]|uniref:Uncharacterized protein n=1 Tax=Neisseria cinerea ATCC 14685 TaxID=546262 RepID=D0W640_NEICI|nr:hypothetical protein NEICINOT_05167 [Neisseria cinerea ATCC 14685]